jgi:hypothetical protein
VSRKKQQTNRRGRSPNRQDRLLPAESRASEAITIAWTVTVTGVTISNLIVVAAHLYARSHPELQPARAFEAIMLMSAAAMGATSLALLPIVWRTRQLKPPLGYTVFAACAAAAPVIVLIGRLLA